MSKKWFYIALIGFIAVGVVRFFDAVAKQEAAQASGAKVKATDESTALDPLLVQTANTINKSAPVVVGETTMLNATAMPGKRLKFIYEWNSSEPMSATEWNQTLDRVRTDAISSRLRKTKT